MAGITVDQLITYLSWSLFVLIFFHVLVQAIQRPSRAHLDIALFFASPFVIIVAAFSIRTGIDSAAAIASYFLSGGVLILPYLIVRVLDNLWVVPRWVFRATEASLVVALGCAWLLPLNRPAWINSILLLYVIGVLAYVVTASIQATLRAHGVTRRRLLAMSIASMGVTISFLAGGLIMWLPAQTELWRTISELTSLTAAIGYFVGFAPPRWLRRVWQEPELRIFLNRVATLPRLTQHEEVVWAFEYNAAEALGVEQMRIGLWSEENQTLSFQTRERRVILTIDDDVPAMQCLLEERVVFSPETYYTEKHLALSPEVHKARAVMVAPITSGKRRLGVLLTYAQRAPVFAEDDLDLIQLLASQAAIVLENHALIAESARLKGREEATRMKEDFLSAAAHDLKTPLTTIIARAQLLERRSHQTPLAPADLSSIRIILAETQRLKKAVLNLLDATGLEQRQLIGTLETVDLVTLAQHVCDRLQSPIHTCTIDGDARVEGAFDPQRMTQMFETLVENAIQYSPNGGPICISVRVQRDAPVVEIRVTDQGVGIPEEDIPQLFTRFHRGSNVNDRRFPGMGLGLFMCKRIVDELGGQIQIESQLNVGTTFHVRLPFVPVEK